MHDLLPSGGKSFWQQDGERKCLGEALEIYPIKGNIKVLLFPAHFDFKADSP